VANGGSSAGVMSSKYMTPEMNSMQYECLGIAGVENIYVSRTARKCIRKILSMNGYRLEYVADRLATMPKDS